MPIAMPVARYPASARRYAVPQNYELRFCTMHVVSIDPAPTKPAVVFNGEFDTIAASDLSEYCESLARKTVLLCWDAPLTGPESHHGSFSQRALEKFFSRAETGFKTPKGISVLPYSGCPHWAITRACLGLPRCGNFDHGLTELPFMLTTAASEIIPDRSRVIETHPAVAIWLWCRGIDPVVDAETTRSWVYKGNRPARTVEELWTLLTGVWMALDNADVINAISNRRNTPSNDDQLDAIVGWVLGTLLVAKHSSVGMLGDLLTGSIALPLSPDMETAFRDFTP